MKLIRSPIVNVSIAFLIATLIAVFSKSSFLERLQYASFDLLFSLKGPSHSSARIIIIEIDDNCILKIGRWPWERTWHAALAKALKELGAKSVYFDILFSEDASGRQDDVFGQAIDEAKNVYLPFAFPERTIDIKNALSPIKNLSSKMKGTGSFNSYPDEDGVLRKIPLVFVYDNAVQYHIALKLAMDYGGLNLGKITNNYIFLYGPNGEVKIPVVDGKKMLINWRGKWKETFKHYSYLDILNAYYDLAEGRKPKIDTKPLIGSICLVGATAIGLYDITPIPIEAEYPAIGAIATTIDNILNGEFIKTLPFWMYLLLIYLLSLIPSLIITGEKITREILLIILVMCFFMTADLLLFNKNLWIDPSLTLLSLFLSYMAINTYNFVLISAEKKAFFKLAVTDELTKLYNIRYFKLILKTECLVAKTEIVKQFCIIMLDIDHFKQFNDTYGHAVGDLVLKKVAGVLNSAVRSSDVVARYGGEEIIILLRGARLQSALEVAEGLRKKVEDNKISDEKNTYKVTISLGVSSVRPNDNEDTIIKRADEGLYKAKNSGRNRVETAEELSAVKV